MDYLQFMAEVVIPRKNANPHHSRLDGWPSGGNLTVAGRFRHHNKLWEVHADSRYEPLFLAEASLKKGTDPFAEQLTRTGKRYCLVLIDSLQRRMKQPGIKHLYIYEAQVVRQSRS